MRRAVKLTRQLRFVSTKQEIYKRLGGGGGGGGRDAERLLRFYKHNVELSLQCKTSSDFGNVVNPKLGNFVKTPQAIVSEIR